MNLPKRYLTSFLLRWKENITTTVTKFATKRYGHNLTSCSSRTPAHLALMQKEHWQKDYTRIYPFRSNCHYRNQLTHAYFIIIPCIKTSRGSAVSTATGYRLDERGVRVRVPVVSRGFSSNRLHQFWGPLCVLCNRYRRISTEGGGGVNRPEREAN
jgi:hypothetical protein